MTMLPDAPWREREGLAALLDALDVPAGATRYVGGAVRDTLAGLAVSDLDLATRLAPQETLERVKRAGFKAVPTGLAHGTVTAVLPSGPVEVTTLRRDVSTDGRRATVAFTDDWREDAARRDFTINALSADPATGEIFDYFDGVADLADARVRFIGDPLVRIAEDHLRILRFFRFHARFGSDATDTAGAAACAARANDLMALSRERIADELIKLLALPDPAPTIALMDDLGILRPFLPEAEGRAADLARLVATERDHHVPPDPLRRLGALLPADAAVARGIAERLKLSKPAQKRLEAAAAPLSADPAQPRRLAYRIGTDAAADWLLRHGAGAEATALDGWRKPRLPLSGGDLIAQGLRAGPVVAATLQAIEREWIDADFPDEAWVRAAMARHLSYPSRDSQ